MEKKDIEIPFGAFDSELGGFEYTIPEGYKAEIKDGKVVVRKTEGEDERIRNEIIAFLKEGKPYYCPNSIKRQEWTAWLEKQGEQKHIPKYKIGDYVKNVNDKREPIYEIVYMDKECYICEYRGKERMGDKAVMHFSFDNPYLRLVQKPADKIESKFKVGDWVVRNGKTLQISGIDTVLDGTFHYWFTKGTWLSSKNMENATLWTIQDAKDGDVLATENFIFIFKNIDNDGGVHYYCHYEIYKHEDDEQFGVALPQSLMGRVGHSFPATKEQRNLLFQKMKEAGYEWDAEKKELKKVEQKFKVGDVIRLKGSAAEYTIKRVTDTTYYTDGWSCGIERCEEDYELVEQKTSAWSEEDEMRFNNIFTLLEELPLSQNWLKSLKHRVQPQPKWSEENETAIHLACEFIRHHSRKGDSIGGIDCTELVKMLKSLRHQSQWKPSETELRVFEEIIDGIANPCNYHATLHAMLEQLKKLREE